MKIRKQLSRYKEPDPIPECELVDPYWSTFLSKKSTGLAPIVHVGPRYADMTECRVKVSNSLNRNLDVTDNFTILMSDRSIIGRCRLPQKHLIAVNRWLTEYEDLIQAVWDWKICGGGFVREYLKRIEHEDT